MGPVQALLSRETALRLLPEALEVKKAFPWQERLLRQFMDGHLPEALDLPTGLGKTSVMAIWLLARAAGAKLPRRLVYVVDRRAVVDQATRVADYLHEFVEGRKEVRAALGLDDGGLPVSTLRGKHVDNRKWLEDPSAPAIIVGTVDMIGSRLLFEGYGVSWKMRPYHAGLLGADSLFVLDEAHLVPPFERLLETVTRACCFQRTRNEGAENAEPSGTANERGLGPSPEARDLVPPVRLLSLSATGRRVEDAFELTDEDYADPEVGKRLGAEKLLDIQPPVASKDFAKRIAESAWGLRGDTPKRILVFCDARRDAEAVHSNLVSFTKGESDVVEVELFVGARRVYERQQAAEWLEKHGFLAGGSAPSTTTILVATSAAEVGVDLDADAAVMDLVEWERMVQRLGRVNRRGGRRARVIVIPVEEESDDTGKKKGERKKGEAKKDDKALRRAACLELLQALPRKDGGFDASPAALTALREGWSEQIHAASTPAPLHPPLVRPLLEAWAMTSLAEHPGRPEAEPWLRGWQEGAAPETTIVFRRYLPVVSTGANAEPFASDALEAFMEAAGPHKAEELVVERDDALRWLRKRVEAVTKAKKPGDPEDEVWAVVVHGARHGKVVKKNLLDDPRSRAEIERLLAGGILFVDERLGGLRNGLLAPDEDVPANGEPLDLSRSEESILPFRVVREEGGADDPSNTAEGGPSIAEADEKWRPEKRFAVDFNPDGEPTAHLVVERRIDSAPRSESGRAVSSREQELEEHQSWVEDEAARLAERLGLQPSIAEALRVAARLHDEGKRARRWQEAFAPNPSEAREGKRILAKSTRAPRRSVLGKYRHELGSLRRMEDHPRFVALDPLAQDLALHLVAAHHGRARPVLPIDDAEEPPSKLVERARQVALRFDRLTQHFGPWGLAWLESLLRAADQKASRRNDRGDA